MASSDVAGCKLVINEGLKGKVTDGWVIKSKVGCLIGMEGLPREGRCYNDKDLNSVLLVISLRVEG